METKKNKVAEFITNVIFGLSIISLFVAFNFSDKMNGWHQQFLPAGGGKPIAGMVFVDSLTGFIVTGADTVGNTNYILKTTDGGDNWAVNATVTDKFYKLQFINDSTGLAIANNKLFNNKPLSILVNKSYICIKTIMRKLHLTKEIDPEIIKTKMKLATNVSDYKRWQIIYNVCVYSVDAEYLSDITGYSKANVYAIVQQFNNSKEPNVTTKPRGGRRRELMSVVQERELMNSLESKALKGEILSGKDIRKIVEKKLNKPVSDDYIWDLFKRNGWTKHSPRPHHPNKNIEAQEEFKKNSKTIWMPLSLILNQH